VQANVGRHAQHDLHRSHLIQRHLQIRTPTIPPGADGGNISHEIFARLASEREIRFCIVLETQRRGGRRDTEI
jgi:hypothetical protein